MVVDVTTFRLASGVEESTFLAADTRVQNELIPNQPGFLRRTTARRDGVWLVVTLWWSESDALAFDTVADADPIQQELAQLITEANSTRFDTLD